MANLYISQLASGGLITNYYCTSKCKHCLYACSPRWEKNYISKEIAIKNLTIIKSLGCNAIHIGGGEPFLNVEGLKDVLEAANEVGIGIQYIETNSSWYKNNEQAVKILKEIKNLDVGTLLISISPFHNEHIPFYKVKGVMSACQQAGINIFPWVEDFYEDINSFDDQTTHSLDEYADKFGDNYIRNIPMRYWIHYGGRVLEFYKKIMPLKDLDEILFSSPRCSELADTSHFHIDLFDNYIPGLCSGFSVKSEDLGQPLHDDKYQIINLLYTSGIAGFYGYATKNFNFKPSEVKYLNKCHLCFDIRKHLVVNEQISSIELGPEEYYTNI